MYSILLSDGTQKHTAAGIKKSVAKSQLAHKLYRETLEGPSMIQHQDRFEDQYIHQKTFRSYNHTINTIDVCKIGLTRYDDKRWVLEDGVTTRPHGHYLNNV